MSADIFASLQTHSDTALLPPFAADADSNNTEVKDGLFASLMNEYTSASEKVLPEILPAVENAGKQRFIFSGNNSFVQTMIKILDSSEENINIFSGTAGPLPENIDTDDVIWPEDNSTSVFVNEKIPADVERTVSNLIAKVKNFVSEKLQSMNLSDFGNIDINEIAEQIIASGDFAEILDSLPEEMRQEVSRVINEIAEGLKHDDGTDTQPVVKIFAAISERIAHPAKKDEKPDISEDEPKNSQASVPITGLEVIPVSEQQIQQTDEDRESQSDILYAPAQNRTQTRTVRASTPEQKGQPEPQAVSDSNNPVQNFREVFAGRTAERGASEHEHPEGDNFSQSQENNSGRQNSSSHSRNDSRRVNSRNQTERTDNSAPTRKTESRSDFQAYFEGVLAGRKSSSTSSPLPLNLRGTANFSQASALRDGITNVVRFIRADGLQKASIIVDPPALGRISVELTNGTSGVEASIKVASEQIRQLVQDQLSQLRMNLSQQGVQVAEFTVDVQQDNSGQHNPQGQEQQNNRVNFYGSTEDDEIEEFRVDLEEGLLYWVA